jgi:hypothetical protein
MDRIMFVSGYDKSSDTGLSTGLDKEGLFLSRSIAHPDNLKGMPDGYWGEWLKLHEYGKFGLWETQAFLPNNQKPIPRFSRPG